MVYGKPPTSNGDYAYIQHIIASAHDKGRCGVVCPQGVLFRGQPEIEEETGEFDDDGNPKVRRRKADDEYLIRKGMLDARMIDAVVGLPLNIFYGAGVPACLLILNKKRPAARRDKVLFIYAARHFRELANQNKLRPQDVMRILVHYHAYGDAAKATKLVKQHSTRLQSIVTAQEAEDVARLTAEYQEFEDAVTTLQVGLAAAEAAMTTAKNKTEKDKAEKAKGRIEKALEKPRKKLAERVEKIAEVRKLAQEDRHAIEIVGQELVALYADPVEFGKHARVVEMTEVEENEFNMNIPRYVDTFEPEEPIDVNAVLTDLDTAEAARQDAEGQLRKLLRSAGFKG